MTASTHPGPRSVTLPAAVVEAVVEHLRDGYPLEACGVIVGDRSPAKGGSPRRFVPMRNAAGSRLRFDIDPLELLALDDELDASGETIWAVVHSHVASAAYPSPTDVRAMELYGEQLHLVVSLADEEPDLGIFRIVDRAIHPVELLVGEGASS